MSGYQIAQPDELIDEAMNRASDSVDSGASNYPGMSYESGFQAAIEWLTDAEMPLSDVLP